jgi:hypothetical protein
MKVSAELQRPIRESRSNCGTRRKKEMKRLITISPGLAPLLLLLGTGLLQAAPIIYTFTGSGTGTLGATPFTSANFVATLTTDTSQVIFQSVFGALGAIGIPAQIDISGVGLETFTGVTFLSTFSNVLDFGEGNGALFNAPGNLIENDNSAFLGYDLVSNKTVTGPNVYLAQFVNANTSGGALSFTRMSNVTFQAAVGTGTPEPATFFLLLGALAAVPLVKRVNR